MDGEGDIITGTVEVKARLFFTCKCGECKNRNLEALSFPVLPFLQREVKCSFHPFITPGEREEMAPARLLPSQQQTISVSIKTLTHALSTAHTRFYSHINISEYEESAYTQHLL